MNTISKLIDVDEVASSLSISPHTIRRWAAQGKLHPIKLGSRILFDPQDVNRFVQMARNAKRNDEPQLTEKLTTTKSLRSTNV